MESVKVRNEQIRTIIPIYEKAIELAQKCETGREVKDICIEHFLYAGVCTAIEHHCGLNELPDWPVKLYENITGNSIMTWFIFTQSYYDKEKNIKLLNARLTVLKQIINKKKINFNVL